ncbi:hypothetical protein Leryth_026003 [Lithospermum erythrorhizon]|nr:hypothetical protein Leryth_026003 [Lithospermum erythrorhizon]
MGRGRGKGKRQADPAEDIGSAEEEKPRVKRRGRPQKRLKDDTDGEEVENLEDHEDDSEKTEVSEQKIETKAVENGRKKKKPSHVKENVDSVEEENGVETRTVSNNSLKSVGFRPNGSRRKNKPRRAAEVGVECI